MTPKDLEMLRISLQLDILQEAIQVLYVAIAKSGTDAPERLREVRNSMRERCDQLRFRNLSPEFSDLISAEYQQLSDRFWEGIEQKLPKTSQ